MGEHERCFELMEYIYYNNIKNPEDSTFTRWYVEYGIYANKYEEVVKAVEDFKKRSKAGDEWARKQLVVMPLDFLYAFRELPDVDEKFKYYALDLLEYAIDETQKRGNDGENYLKYIEEIKGMLKEAQ